MTYGAIAVGVGSVVGAGANIYGSNQAAKAATAGSNSANGGPPAVAFNPRNDPLLSALSFEDQLNLGLFRPDALTSSSPIDLVINTIATGGGGVPSNKLQAVTKAAKEFKKIVENGIANGLSEAEINRQIKKVEKKKFGPNAGVFAFGMSLFKKAAAAAGFSGRGAIVNAQIQFGEAIEGRLASGQGVADAVGQGRNDARLGIADLQSNFITPTRESIDSETSNQQDLLNQMIQEQANTGGFNPANNLALSRNSALQNALTILGGEQGLQSNALSSLQSSLLAPQQLAQGTAGINTGASISSSQIAANQALGLANLQQQRQLAGAQATGAGIAGAGGSLSNGLLAFAIQQSRNDPSGPSGSRSDDLFNQLLNQKLSTGGTRT